MSTKKGFTKNNIGSLLIKSLNEALSHAKGIINLSSVKITQPIDSPKNSKTNFLN